MQVTYFAVKKSELGDRAVEPGDLIPEVESWPYLYAHINAGKIAAVKVSTLTEEEQEALIEYERTGKFSLYDDRNGKMAERDMRPTSIVPDKERIDGSDKAIEADGLPDAPEVDESSESTPKGIEASEDDVEVVEVDEQYSEWSNADLKKECDNRKIDHSSGATKADLVALLEQDDAESESKKAEAVKPETKK